MLDQNCQIMSVKCLPKQIKYTNFVLFRAFMKTAGSLVQATPVSLLYRDNIYNDALFGMEVLLLGYIRGVRIFGS